MRRLACFALGLLGLLLTACSNNTELALLTDHKWELKESTSFDPRMIPSIGTSIQIVEGVSVDVNASDTVEPLSRMSMDMLVQQLRTQGYDARWSNHKHSDGEVEYEVVIAGQGYDRLAQVSSLASSGNGQGVSQGSQMQVTDNGNGTLLVVLNYPQGTGMFGTLANNTAKVRGGKIVASNATRVEGNTAIWDNPSGRLEATVTPLASLFNLPSGVLVAGGIVLAVLVVGGGAFVLVRNGVSRQRMSSAGGAVRAHRMSSSRPRR
jgi:hypothetical protein